jgi:hypothetical protein
LSRSAEEGRNDRKFPVLDGGGIMIIISFWTLNPSLPPSKIGEVAANLMQKGLYPAKHSKTLAWYVCPGGKGVTITEIDGAPADEVAFENWLMWPREYPGIFSSFESLPGVTAEKAVSMVLK